MSAVALATSEVRAAADKKTNRKRKRKRCRRDARQCKQEAAAYCAAYHSNASDACTTDINRCCRFLRKCNYRKTNRCGEQVSW